MSLAKGVFVVAAKRTAFGAFGGKFKNMSATDLQVVANKAAMAASSVAPEQIDSVIVGNVIQSSVDAPYIARHSALRCDIPKHIPCLTVNRLCGSGFQSIITGAQEVMLNESGIVLCGGAENMTQAPFTLRDVRFGIKLGIETKLEDSLWEGLTDQLIKTPMGITAENLAEKYEISRQDADNFALRSQQNWKKGLDGGHFKAEIAPVTLKTRKGVDIYEVDEHPRPDVTAEGLAKLPPVFKKNGTVNAGNASGICDGASAVIVASEAALKQHNLTPLARIVAYNAVGCDPSIMGIGPVPAIRNILKATGKKLDDVDLYEVNEAFASQSLAVIKELGLEMEKTNCNGGAIALGHPLGASGNRITAHLVHELRRRNLKTAIGSACIGGGQGIAIMLERC